MKHLILFLGLSLGLSTLATTSSAIAQDTNSAETSIEENSSSKNKLSINDGEFNFDLNYDLADNDQEKLDKIVDIVGEVINDDVAKELSVEFKTLDNEEKLELIEVIENGFSIESSHSGDSSTPLLPIIIVMIVFGFPILMVMVLANSGQKRRVQKMELVSMYLEADKDIPPHVINAFEKGGSDSSLRSGLVLTGVGLAIVIALNVSGDGDAAAFGFIPMFIGIARLIFWYFEERKYLETYSSKESSTREPK